MIKVLLCDDSLTIQKVVRLTFMDSKYYELVVANQTQELPNILTRFSPDVLLLYAHFTEDYIPGFIKQFQLNADQVIIFSENNEDLRELKEAGFTQFLKKPFQTEELYRLVNKSAGIDAPSLSHPIGSRPPAPPKSRHPLMSLSPPEGRPHTNRGQTPSIPLPDVTLDFSAIQKKKIQKQKFANNDLDNSDKKLWKTPPLPVRKVEDSGLVKAYDQTRTAVAKDLKETEPDSDSEESSDFFGNFEYSQTKRGQDYAADSLEEAFGDEEITEPFQTTNDDYQLNSKPPSFAPTDTGNEADAFESVFQDVPSDYTKTAALSAEPVEYEINNSAKKKNRTVEIAENDLTDFQIEDRKTYPPKKGGDLGNKASIAMLREKLNKHNPSETSDIIRSEIQEAVNTSLFRVVEKTIPAKIDAKIEESWDLFVDQATNKLKAEVLDSMKEWLNQELASMKAQVLTTMKDALKPQLKQVLEQWLAREAVVITKEIATKEIRILLEEEFEK